MRLSQSCPVVTESELKLPLMWTVTTADSVHELLYPCNCLCIAKLLPGEAKASQLSGLKLSTSSKLHIALCIVPSCCCSAALPLDGCLDGGQ